MSATHQEERAALAKQLRAALRAGGKLTAELEAAKRARVGPGLVSVIESFSCSLTLLWGPFCKPEAGCSCCLHVGALEVLFIQRQNLLCIH